MEKLIQSRYIFSHGSLQVTFNIIDPYQNSVHITGVDFYVYDIDNPTSGSGSWQLLEAGVDFYPTNTVTNDSYDVFVPSGDNHLVKAEIHTDSTVAPTMCCATIASDGTIIVTDYFIDLSGLQKKMLENMRFTCDNNCNIPAETVNNLLRLFSIQMAADSGDKIVERIYAKFVGNVSSSVSRSSSNCGCNG